MTFNGRKRRIASLAFVFFGVISPTAPAETLSITVPQARKVALESAVSGRPDVALTLTQKLLAEDPEDTTAHLASGTAHLAMGDWDAAYSGGRMAFRHAQTDGQKYQAARVAALAAMGDDRKLISQFWLRRAGDVAPTEVDRTRIERQFRILKAQTPLSYRFDFSSTPSSNVNGGSEVAYNVIDGVPLVGVLSADAQALSGFITQGSVRAKYRFAKSDTSQTFATAVVYAKHVSLSSSARAAAPGFDAGTLGATSLEFGLNHARAVGQSNTLLNFKGGFRGQWQAGALSYTALTAGVDLQHSLSQKLTFSGGVAYEYRDYAAGGTGTIASAVAGLTYRFANGNSLTGVARFSESKTPNVTFDSQSVTGKITYSLGKPVLSTMLSAGVGISQTDYADYRLGFIPVPGGRTDKAIFFDVEAKFTSIEYAGFSPNLKLRHTQNESNLSRYDTSEWAVSLGIQSNF